MSIPLVGQPGNAPFDRTFFNVRLDQLIEKAGGSDDTRVDAYLSDGAKLGLCHIEELGSTYMIVRAHDDAKDGCDLSLHIVPYHLIYRMEIDPTGGAEPRMGFKRRPPDPE